MVIHILVSNLVSISKSIQIKDILYSSIPQLLSAVSLCSLYRVSHTASLDIQQLFFPCQFDCCSVFCCALFFSNNPHTNLQKARVIACFLTTSDFSVRLTVSGLQKLLRLFSATWCVCDIIWCVCDIILCDSSAKSSVHHSFIFMMSSCVTCSSNPSVHYLFMFVVSSCATVTYISEPSTLH